MHLIPSDLGNLEAGGRGETPDPPLEDTESRGAGMEFFAAFEQRLVADTDAQKRPASHDGIFHTRKQILALQGRQAVIESTHSREHHTSGLANPVRMLQDFNVRPRSRQRLVHAFQIPRPIVQ